MSGITLANLGLKGDIPDHSTWGDEGRANDRRLDALIMASVKSIVNDPPGSAADGDRYMMGDAPTAAWAGSPPGSIATWNGAASHWDIYVPKKGWSAYVESDRSTRRYDSGWTSDLQDLNVKRFGAKGDGTTDDSAAVLAAIVAAPAGSRVYFPAGNYKLTSWSVSTLNKSLWLAGDGMGNSVLTGLSGTSFLSITANFRCSGITFDTWSNVFDFSAVATVLDKVLIEDSEFKTYNRGVYGLNLGGLQTFTADAPTDTLTTPLAHGFAVNDELRFISTTTLPGGISPGTSYFVKTTPLTTTFTLSATPSGATLDITSAGTGTHTVFRRVGVRGFAVRSCRFTTSTSYAIFLGMPIMENIHIVGNVIKDCIQRAIDLGNNSLVFADDRGNYLISGNLVDGCTNVGASSIAVICYGWRAVITGNIVRNVTRTSTVGVPSDSDCDGIYTKCRYSVVADNVLVDAGQAEAFINVKGGAHNETVTQPYGFSVIVAGNVLLDTQTNPLKSTSALLGPSKRSNGIKIATSEVMVVDNYLEGLCDVGIYSDSDTGSDAPCHNIVIARNTIKNHRGKAAIELFGRGDRIRVIDNLIDVVSNTFDDVALPQGFGIKAAKKGGGGVDISRNRVFKVQDAGATPVGIQINPSTPSFTITANPATDVITTSSTHGFVINDVLQFQTTGTLPAGISLLTDYYVISAPTVTTLTISTSQGGGTLNITDAGTGVHTVKQHLAQSGYRVMDNDIDTAKYGVQFTYDESLSSINDAFVRHNTGRNINGNVIPVLADLVKFTDVPTNLLSLPAESPVVGYEAVDKAAIFQASGSDRPQELRVYRNRIDATDYERVVMRAKSTSSVIGTEFAGNVDIGAGPVVAVKRALEFGVAQTAGVAITSYWRISTSGNYEPLTDDTLFIGSASLRVKRLHLSGDLNMADGTHRNANLILPGTNTATVGNVTIDEISGRAILAAGATTVVVTSNKLSAAAHVFCTIRAADANNPRIKSVVYSASGGAHITITVDTAPAADLAVDFLILDSA